MAATTPDDHQATSAGEFLTALAVIESFVKCLEPERYDARDAARLTEGFALGKRLCGAGETLIAERAARGNAHLATGHRTPEEWLSSVSGTSRGEAKDLLRVGEALGSQPAVEDALRAGRLTPRQATLVSDAAKINPGREQDLVKSAETDTVNQLKDRCLRAKSEGRSAEDGERHRRTLHVNRRCRTFTDTDGAFCLEAHLTPETGAGLKAALDTQCDRFFQKARRAGRFENVDAYRADALVALITGEGILPAETRRKGTRSAPPGGADPTSPTADRSDCRSHGPDATVHIRVDLAALRRGNISNGEICEIPGVGPVSVTWAREILGAALLDLVITDGVDVTTVVRLGRHVPTALLTAILERDQCCVVPGCGKRLGLENDHWQVDFADGGPISYDNIARVCTYHHRLKTHQGWALTQENGQWRFDPPEAVRGGGPIGRKRRRKGRKTGSAGPPPDPGPSPPSVTDQAAATPERR